MRITRGELCDWLLMGHNDRNLKLVVGLKTWCVGAGQSYSTLLKRAGETVPSLNVKQMLCEKVSPKNSFAS